VGIVAAVVVVTVVPLCMGIGEQKANVLESLSKWRAVRIARRRRF
jgi:hypothetical protein